MTNLKNQGTKTVATRIRPFKAWSIFLGLALVAAACSPAAQASTSSDNTFTKWVTTTAPAAGVVGNMVGVVGGDVGTGTYAGEILAMNTVGTTTSIHAAYHFNGSKQSFTADVNITQDETAGTATITGKVTDGWLKGASVTGKYNVLKTCTIPTPANAYGTLCYQGSLHVGP